MPSNASLSSGPRKPKAKQAPPTAKPFTDPLTGIVYPSKKSYKKAMKDVKYQKDLVSKKLKEKEEKAVKRKEREEREAIAKGAAGESKTNEEEEEEARAKVEKEKERLQKLEAHHASRSASASSTFSIAVDFAWEEVMTRKEKLSLATQIVHCHAYNKRQEGPVDLILVGMGEGDTRNKVGGHQLRSASARGHPTDSQSRHAALEARRISA